MLGLRSTSHHSAYVLRVRCLRNSWFQPISALACLKNHLRWFVSIRYLWFSRHETRQYSCSGATHSREMWCEMNLQIKGVAHCKMTWRECYDTTPIRFGLQSCKSRWQTTLIASSTSTTRYRHHILGAVLSNNMRQVFTAKKYCSARNKRKIMCIFCIIKLRCSTQTALQLPIYDRVTYEEQVAK